MRHLTHQTDARYRSRDKALEERLYSDKPGQQPLPTKLMASLSIHKHTHNMSDEDLGARFLETRTSNSFAVRSSFATNCRSIGRR